MLTTGALLLIIADGPAIASTAPVACPAQSIGFAPPLDVPLLLTRRIERELANGTFTQTIRYRLRFDRVGRGYRMRWQQIDSQASGPPELLRLLTLQEEGSEGETLDFALDDKGVLLGVTEAPDAALRMDEAIARLRRDPAMISRPAREQQILGQLLDRMAALEPAERADIQLAKATRLLVLAGRECRGGIVTGSDGTGYRLAAAAAASGTLQLIAAASEQRPDGSTLALDIEIALSARTGLIESHDRRTTSRIGAISRVSREWLGLSVEQAGAGDTAKPTAAPTVPQDETSGR